MVYARLLLTQFFSTPKDLAEIVRMPVPHKQYPVLYLLCKEEYLAIAINQLLY
jgi:hypothetical protein